MPKIDLVKELEALAEAYKSNDIRLDDFHVLTTPGSKPLRLGRLPALAARIKEIEAWMQSETKGLNIITDDRDLYYGYALQDVLEKFRGEED